MLNLLFIITNILFDIAYSSDFCAFGHAIQPDSTNNLAATHNWINGEFIRDTTYESGGQSDLWQGTPYYKMIQPGPCFIQVLYLFRHINSFVYPAVNKWVISGGMGTSPDAAYAYCSIDSDLQDTPDGNCDGKWMVKKDNNNFELDTEFAILPGGCPQPTCESIMFHSTAQQDWMPDYNDVTQEYYGIFANVEPNIYKQTGVITAGSASDNTADGGTFYLYWNPKVWTWAVNAFINDYDDCAKYKTQNGASLVANVIGGAYSNSIFPAQEPRSPDRIRFSVAGSSTSRFMTCTGTVTTGSPTAQHAAIPSKAPNKVNLCGGGWSPNSSPSTLQYIDTYCRTPSPVQPSAFTTDPTDAPIVPGSPTKPPTQPTPEPTPGPTVTAGSPSNPPTTRPTPGPTVPKGSPSRSPTMKPVIAGGDDSTGDDGTGDDDNGSGDNGDYGNKLNCNMCLICAVVALYKLLF